jgi:hypothetical protein
MNWSAEKLCGSFLSSKNGARHRRVSQAKLRLLVQNLSEIISHYVSETRRLEALPSSTETTFYPDLKTLLNAVLSSERLPFDVTTGTSEGGPRRRYPTAGLL